MVCASGVAGKSVKMSSVRFGSGGGKEVPPGRNLMERDGVPASRQTTTPMREGGDQVLGKY